MADPPRDTRHQGLRRRPRESGEAALRELILHSPEETIGLGEALGAAAAGGLVIALRGGLGAGKTTFAKGFARGLGVEGEVTSPTYTIVSEYEGRLRLHHVDAYRLSGPEDFDSVGGEDLLSDAGGVCLIEWSERVSEALPAEAAIAEFEVLEDGCRRLRIEGAALETMIPKEGDTLEAMTPKEGDALGGDRGRSLGRSRP